MVFAKKKFDPAIHHRRSIRLKGYDYTSPGLYFITLNTFHRLPLFGRIEKGTMKLNEFGVILREEWLLTEQIRPFIWLDAFIVMPDHFHGIIGISQSWRRGDDDSQ